MTDNVNSPDHYASNTIECINYIYDTLGVDGFVDYCRGNIMKYNHRVLDKNKCPVEDFKKMQKYAEFAINALEGKKPSN